MKRMITLILGLFVGLICMPSMTVKADYRYNIFEETLPAQPAFVAEKNYNGKQLDIGSFNKPTDIYVYQDAFVYVLDGGNNRVVVLNQEFEVEKIIAPIMDGAEEQDISGAKGIYVSEAGEIYISDTPNARVLVVNDEGEVLRTITRPSSMQLTEDIMFLPKNVVIDTTGTIYIISENSTQGAYMLGPNNEFLGFYGRNEMDVTAEVLFQAAMRKIATEEQRARMSNFIPVEFSNFDIDQEGFIYTVTNYSSTPKTADMIRKLNPLGLNILTNAYRTWGDEPEGGTFYTNYVDVAVDNNGFIYALDSTNGRIFMYDNTGFQVAIMGGKGMQLGYFQSAAAIDTLGEQIIVLDAQKSNLTVFKKTTFGNSLINGLRLYNQGNVDEALKDFEEIIKMDANFFFAYHAMAETYYDKGEYELAAEYAELSGVSQETYSKAKKMIRNNWLRQHFLGVFVAVIVVALLIMAVSKVREAKRKERRLIELMERRSDT